jgi:hypothetical protein
MLCDERRHWAESRGREKRRLRCKRSKRGKRGQGGKEARDKSGIEGDIQVAFTKHHRVPRAPSIELKIEASVQTLLGMITALTLTITAFNLTITAVSLTTIVPATTHSFFVHLTTLLITTITTPTTITALCSDPRLCTCMCK